MKTVKITLNKEGAQAACTLQYHFTDWPEKVTWAGNRKAFVLKSGHLIHPTGPLEKLDGKVAFQASQCGATFKIEDLGGEAETWTDEVLP